jgi:hypothetical protein
MAILLIWVCANDEMTMTNLKKKHINGQKFGNGHKLLLVMVKHKAYTNNQDCFNTKSTPSTLTKLNDYLTQS